MTDPKPIKVDLRTKDTELGWMMRIDKLALIGVPAWFNLLGWVALLSGIEYLRRQSGSILLGFIAGISTVFIWRYLVALIVRMEFIGIIPNTSPRKQLMISIAITTFLVSGGIALVMQSVRIIADLTESQPVVQPAQQPEAADKQ